jgi:Cu/Ag efflux protein CusF
MRKLIFAMAALALVAGTFAPAQKAAREPKDALHMTGTVSKINGDTVTLTVADQTADLKLLPTTTYKVGVKPATSADIRVGDNINAWIVRKNPDWLAQSVKITHPKK